MVRFQTNRGYYLLKLTGEPQLAAQALMLTLSLEEERGFERLAFRCCLATALLGEPILEIGAIVARLGAWLARDFEQVREAALKSIRSERKLFEFKFDLSNRGPFSPNN